MQPELKPMNSYAAVPNLDPSVWQGPLTVFPLSLGVERALGRMGLRKGALYVLALVGALELLAAGTRLL